MEKIRVLLAFQNSMAIEQIKNSLSGLNRLRFYESTDGTDCLFKLTNVTPNILIIEDCLDKRSGLQVIDWILKKGGALNKIGVILISDEGLPTEFEDACAIGRINIVSKELGPSQIKLAFVKAFNFYSGTNHHEFRIRLLEKGSVLIREGERADNVYLLQRGQLRAVRNNGAGEQFLGDILAGEFVGEMAYINQDMRSATVIAEEECELIEIPIQFADQILFRKPSWAKALMRTLSKRLKKSNLRQI